MAQKPLSALDAYLSVTGGGRNPAVGRFSSYMCPYPECGIVSQHQWGNVKQLVVKINDAAGSSRTFMGGELTCSFCESCKKEVLFHNGQLIWPTETDAPLPSPDLPPSLLEDFQEAREIYIKSPRGAAALLRLVIQKLCIELGSTEKDINKAIGKFVSDGKISPMIQKALDAVRVIGNEAVHPGSIDLRDDSTTVNSLFGLINFIVEKMIGDPKRIDEIYGSLPQQKLEAIANRDRPVD